LSPAVIIPKRLEYKKATKLLIRNTIQINAWKNEIEITGPDTFIKWRMPKESGGFLKYRKNDPL
jgi:hypothetical protein